MLKLVTRFLDWIKSLFWKEEMELTLVGLQFSGKTTFVSVIAVSNICMYLASSITSTGDVAQIIKLGNCFCADSNVRISS